MKHLENENLTYLSEIKLLKLEFNTDETTTLLEIEKQRTNNECTKDTERHIKSFHENFFIKESQSFSLERKFKLDSKICIRCGLKQCPKIEQEFLFHYERFACCVPSYMTLFIPQIMNIKKISQH